MTVLHSALLVSAGFEHGFGTRWSTPVDIPENVHILRQIHGERIVVLSENPESRIQNPEGLSLVKTSNTVVQGLPDDPFRFDKGDALITDIPGVSIGIRTADCLPVLLADISGGAACAVHCGWRSLAAGLAGKTVNVFLQFSGSKTENLRAVLGPSIGICHYEIGEDVRQVFNDSDHRYADLFEERKGSLHMDLDAGVKTQLLSAGMRAGDIEKISGCTVCDRDQFWSYRCGDNEERMISWITAREPLR
jgi:YfiH family protein